jgi:hypothetical protein
MMSDPKEVFLAPYCEGAYERIWCEDDMAGDWCHCEECEGKPGVRYVRADLYVELEAQLAEARKLLRMALPHVQQERDDTLAALIKGVLAGQGGNDE